MFNLNRIDSRFILLILTLNANALHNPREDLFNVGTVLFTSNDLSKKRWSRTSLELLQARRYFQSIIPSPSMNTLNEDYVKSLIKYFTNTFSTLKREVIDPGLVEVMERALADAVGGYLKVWVLPVTKFAYYGGTVSKQNAVKVFDYYERLKRNLDTKGDGWRKPSDIILNYVAITVVPYSHVSRTRSLKDACEHLAYYEKSDTGLTIPMPYINWNEPPYSMFLPLKNESLMQLDSPSSSEALMKYYDVAESCCHAKNPDGCSEFDLRFQDWLSNNVVPHINDDKLYIAFGSLLGLLNKTNEFIRRASNICEYDYSYDKYTLNSVLAKLPPWMTSNKFLILILILIVEIIWCVPAMFYIICTRRKRKMKQRTKFFLDVFKIGKSERYQTVGRIDESEERNHFVNQRDPKNVNSKSHVMENGVNISKKSNVNDMEALTQSPSNTSKHTTGQVTSVFSNINNNEPVYGSESVIFIDEKKSLNALHSSHMQTTILPVSNDVNDTNRTKSVIKVQKLETTITKILRDKSDSNSRSCDKSSSSNKTLKRISSEVKQKLQELSNKDETNFICPCSRCIEQEHKDVEEPKTAEIKESRAVKVESSMEGTTRLKKAIDTTNRTKLPKLKTKFIDPIGYSPKNIKLNKSKGLKLNSGEPLLEIRIDKPPTEITLGVVKTTRKNVKPSKIPRLATGVSPREENIAISTPRNEKTCACVQEAFKTVEKLSMDDFNVKTKPDKRSKMNITL